MPFLPRIRVKTSQLASRRVLFFSDLRAGTGNVFDEGVNGETSKDENQRRNWREICEQIVREKTPERFEDLLAELLEALEERRARGLAIRNR